MKLLILTILLMANSCILEGCAGAGPRNETPSPIELVENARIGAISADKQIISLLDLKSISKADAQKYHDDIVKVQEDLDLAGGLLRDAIPGNDADAMTKYRAALSLLTSVRSYLATKEKPQ